jgi:dienelactone hydrolase
MAQTSAPVLARPIRWVAIVLVVSSAAWVAAAAASAGVAPRGCPGSGAQIGAPRVGGDDTPGVTRIVFTFVDRSRPSRPDGGDEVSGDPQCRVLETAVHLPTVAAGPVPLILAVHGLDGDPAPLRPLIDTWTTAGYVVAAPSFLVTAKNRPGASTGSASSRQAGDARFVLDQVLSLDADPTSPLYGRIDPRHIGVAGMSLGGMTAYGLISNTCCRDRRITAAVLLAAVYRPFPRGKYVRQHVPVLLIQGDNDRGYHNSLTAYPGLTAPKWFVTLHGSTHSPPFEIPRGPEAQLVDTTTTAFWQEYLGDEHGAAHRIDDEVEESKGSASLRKQLARTGG